MFCSFSGRRYAVCSGGVNRRPEADGAHGGVEEGSSQRPGGFFVCQNAHSQTPLVPAVSAVQVGLMLCSHVLPFKRQISPSPSLL